MRPSIWGWMCTKQRSPRDYLNMEFWRTRGKDHIPVSNLKSAVTENKDLSHEFLRSGLIRPMPISLPSAVNASVTYRIKAMAAHVRRDEFTVSMVGFLRTVGEV
jgi:hypothetical protein